MVLSKGIPQCARASPPYPWHAFDQGLGMGVFDSDPSSPGRGACPRANHRDASSASPPQSSPAAGRGALTALGAKADAA
eukprot:1481630-Prymnesium_polylepis.1